MNLQDSVNNNKNNNPHNFSWANQIYFSNPYFQIKAIYKQTPVKKLEDVKGREYFLPGISDFCCFIIQFGTLWE